MAWHLIGAKPLPEPILIMLLSQGLSELNGSNYSQVNIVDEGDTKLQDAHANLLEICAYVHVCSYRKPGI